MEQAIIFIIVAVLMGLSKGAKKLKESQQESETPNPPPNRNLPSAPPELTEADRRYREIQEEIRRRVAQRQQEPQNTSAPATPVPQRPRAMPNMGVPPRPAPKPISTYQRNAPAPQPAIPATPPTILAPMVMPVATSASTTEAAATEAAAYALPESNTADTSIKAYTISVPSGKLRALLSSPASARQSFVLREIFDRPLSLRQVPYGGYESWN